MPINYFSHALSVQVKGTRKIERAFEGLKRLKTGFLRTLMGKIRVGFIQDSKWAVRT